jgi:oxygen-independent coproporphyrinogen-3 oxidase
MLEEAGYTVVSGYAAVKTPAHHRFQYQEHLWRGGDMLGLGVGSFSYFGGVHFQNYATLDEYGRHIAADGLPWMRSFQLGPWDRLVREFTLQLKWGEVDLRAFEEKFGLDLHIVFAQPLRQLAAEGFLACTREKVRLTRRGLLRVDRILREFQDLDFQFARYT